MGFHRAGLLNATVSGLFRMTELIDQLKENYLKGGRGGGGHNFLG